MTDMALPSTKAVSFARSHVSVACLHACVKMPRLHGGTGAVHDAVACRLLSLHCMLTQHA